MKISSVKNNLIETPKLEIAGSRIYSAKQAGLTKLLFDNEVLLIMYNGEKGRIKDINLEPRSDIIQNLLGNNLYEEIIFPVWNMDATIEGPIKGTISGVIKPRIVTRLDINQTKYLVPNATSELFFYVIGKNICIEGKSTYLASSKNAEFKGLECKVRDVSLKTITGNIPDIKFRDTFTDNCYIYTGTRLPTD